MASLALAPAWATPLQPRLEIPQLSGDSVDFGASATGSAVETIVDFSTLGGFAGPAPLSPLSGEGLRRLLPTPDPLPLGPPPSQTGAPSPAATNPAMKIFREIVSEGTGLRSELGFVPESNAANQGNPAGTVHSQPEGSGGEEQVTLRDLVRLLINRPENLGLATRVSAPTSHMAGPAGPQGVSILNTILSIAVDKEIVQAISKVLRPSIDINGVVALNVFGLREIALLVSPSSNSIRLIDMESGRSISFRHEDYGDMLMQSAERPSYQTGVPQGKIDRESALPKVIAAIRLWLLTYVFNGFTLIVLVAITLFWTVWRLARSE